MAQLYAIPHPLFHFLTQNSVEHPLRMHNRQVRSYLLLGTRQENMVKSPVEAHHLLKSEVSGPALMLLQFGGIGKQEFPSWAGDERGQNQSQTLPIAFT